MYSYSKFIETLVNKNDTSKFRLHALVILLNLSESPVVHVSSCNIFNEAED